MNDLLRGKNTKAAIIGGACVLLLWATNPTMADMKEAAPTDSDLLEILYSNPNHYWIEKDRKYVRRWNFIVCSVYTMEFNESISGVEPDGMYPHSFTYLGVAKNIISLTSIPEEASESYRESLKNH